MSLISKAISFVCPSRSQTGTPLVRRRERSDVDPTVSPANCLYYRKGPDGLICYQPRPENFHFGDNNSNVEGTTVLEPRIL